MANYKDIIQFIKDAEGGMSNAGTDTAKENTSPCTYKGTTNWHTNKGIQWISFKNNASKLGYSASCDNFINMPDSIWGKIYKKAYWDAFNLDNSKSQVIANTVVSWAWGSGVGGAYKSLAKFINTTYGKSYPTTYTYTNAINLVSDLNVIASKNGEKDVFDKLAAWRLQFYKDTGQTANIAGWTNRLNKFKIFNEGKMGDITNFQLNFVKQYWWVIALGTAGIVGIVYATTNLKK